MTLDNWIHVVTIFFGAGGALSYYASVRRVKYQNALDISTAWEKFSTPLMERLSQLDAKVVKLEHENSDLRDWATRLYKQALDHGIKKPEQFIRHNYDGDGIVK